MFGIYSNKRIGEAERKILCEHPDDYNWYCVVLRIIFKDRRFFQVREDIEIPQSEDDDGVVLIFQDGDVVYFKTIDGDVTDEEIRSIYKVCSYLEGMFNRPIDSYVVFPYHSEFKANKIEGDGEIRIVFSSLKADNGEEILERLESKLKNHEEFTVSDSIDHMLLPYVGYHDKELFEEKFRSYMNLIESLNMD